jgi:plastocyanin
MFFAAIAFAMAAPPGVMAGSGSSATIDMNDMAFGAAPANLQVGETLRFENNDVFEHTATAPGAFDLDLKPGESGGVVLQGEGPLDIACRYHPTMKLHLQVRARTISVPSEQIEAPK